ncbi:MAG: DUF7093 family protein, partial [Acidimicrobiales bacterium]
MTDSEPPEPPETPDAPDAPDSSGAMTPQELAAARRKLRRGFDREPDDGDEDDAAGTVSADVPSTPAAPAA